MGFVTALVISLVLTVVGELLRPKQKPQNAKASGLDDFSIPTAEEGRQIQLWWGKVKIDGANVTAYGDLQSIPLTKKIKTGLFSSTRQTYAHKYFLGMQMVLGWGPCNIHEIRFGDSMPNHTRTDEGDGVIRFDFNDENFFGGKEKEGGISGTLRFYTGTDEQGPSEYLAELVDDTVPAYKNIVHAMLEKMYIGTSEYIKPMSFIASRYTNGLEIPDGKHMIGDDINPVSIIYDVVTNPVYALGLQASDIDAAAWREVAATLHAEGYGMSVIYNGGSSANDIISDVLRHVDGVLFSDISTGLLTLRLARGGYDVETLPVFGQSDFLQGIDFSRPSWSETKNVIRGTYVNRDEDYTVSPVTQQDLANLVQRNNESALEEIDFTGFSEFAPCALAVARALKTLSYPLAKVSGSLNSRGRTLKPADVFVLQWPNLGIDSVVFRVVRVRYGGLESNVVEIEAVEDVFAVEEIGYVQPPPSGWTNPAGPPQPVLRQSAAGMPYPMLPVEGEIIATYATRAGGMDEGYFVMSDRGDGYVERGASPSWTPSAVTAAAWPATSSATEAQSPPLTSMRMIDQADNDVPLESMRTGAGLMRVVSSEGEEWMAYASIGPNRVLTVWRGIFDTPPLSHPDGAVVWFASSGQGYEGAEPFGAPVTVDIKLLPFNARGRLPIEDATEMTVTTSQRGSRPFPPGKPRVNGAFPGPDIAGSFVFSWAHRSRVAETITRQDDEAVTPEDGTTYVVQAHRVDNDVLLAQGEGNGQFATIQLNYTGTIRLSVWAKRNAMLSHKPQVFEFAYTGTTTSLVVDNLEYIVDGGEVTP